MRRASLASHILWVIGIVCFISDKKAGLHWLDNPAGIYIDLWIASGNEDKTQNYNPEDSKANAIAKTACFCWSGLGVAPLMGTAAKLNHPGTRPLWNTGIFRCFVVRKDAYTYSSAWNDPRFALIMCGPVSLVLPSAIHIRALVPKIRGFCPGQYFQRTIPAVMPCYLALATAFTLS